MRLVDDYDPITGMWVTFEYDHSEDKFIIGHHQDTTAIIESNRQALLDTDSHRRQAKNEWAHYARIPNIVILEWRQKYGVDFFNLDHGKRVMQLLESPEYKDCKRTTYKHLKANHL